MCGIAGYVGRYRSREESAAELVAMCDAITHRGPDDAGYWVAPGVALGMRRLSIIDVEGSRQPIANEGGDVRVVFNGEIYNYRELRQRLHGSGHRLATDGDTETLVHLYEEAGARLVDSLRGMFAFAIWDARRERLTIARDRLGIKPLYYWESEGGLAFASELKSLLALPGFPRHVHRPAVADYLALGYVPEPECVYAGVKKLEPGCVLQWERGAPARITRYWTPVREEDPRMEAEEAAAEIRRLLTESVRYRLIADVPLGAFLSGGIDSAAVVAEMARQMDRPVQTFSIGFDEPEFNEAPRAAAVARALRTDHTELVVRPDVEELMERIVVDFDEPFADSSAIPTYLVSRLARERVTVALSGDGGDELFGGYTRYRELLGRDLPLPAPVRRALGAFARRLPASARGRNRLLELSRARSGRYAGMVADALPVAEGGVAWDELSRQGHSQDALLRRWFDRVPGHEFASQMMLVDLMSYLPGDILTKVDRMSMLASLEARVPLLDHHLVEFAATIPSSLKMRDGTGKWIFRRAITGLVPDSVFHGPKKGFGVPIALWMRGPLRHHVDALLEPGSPLFDFVDPRAVEQRVSEHQAGRRDQSPLLWKLLVLRMWLQAQAAPATRPDPAAVASLLVSVG